MAKKKYLDSSGLTTLTSMIKAKVDDVADKKQDKLVSNTNIKTVGGSSLLGSGNISVGVTGVGTGAGLTGGTITSTGTIKCNLNSEASLGTIGSTSNLYAVGVDSNNKLGVKIPTVSDKAPGLMSATDKSVLDALETEMGEKATTAALTAATSRITTAEGKISALETEVGKKATADALTAATSRITTAESDISALKTGLDKKATTEALTAATNRITTAEGKITAAESDIAALETEVGKKATTAALTAATNRITTAESDISALETEVDKKATTEALTAATNRITTAESDISALETEVDKKATTAALTAATNRITTAEGKITTAEGKISALETEIGKKATTEALTAATSRITTAESDIAALETEVDKKATIEALTTATNRITTAEGKITTLEGELDGALDRIAGAETELDKKAPLANPVFTGAPKAETPSSSTNNTQIATTAFVHTVVNNKIAAADAMIYKGTIGTNGTVTSLPNTTAKTGWTYKVITAGTYGSNKCEIGDLIICLTDGSSTTNATWTVIQTNIDGAVVGPATAVNGRIAVFDDTSGKVIKDSGYTIAKSVPSNAVFTDSSTTLAGHYAPDSNGASSMNASNGSATNITGTSGKLNVVTGLKHDAKGHIVGVTSANIYSTDNNTNYYPTEFAWTNGTTAGPTGSLTGTGMSAVSFGAIPSASASASGVVTTGAQTFAGSKTFTDNITILAENTDKFINFKYTSTDLDSYSWRIGYLGTGSGDNNALTFQTNKTGAWVDALKFTLPGDATFSQSVTATKFITAGGTSSQFVRGNGSCTALTKSEITTALGYTPPTANTDTSTTYDGHYTPTENTNAAISASGGTATNITGTSGKLSVVTGLKRDAKGHIVGVTSANIYSTDNNTDTSTTLAGHYTPTEDTQAAISASGGSATNITGTGGKLNVVTGLKRDAKGHIVGVTSANIYSTDNNSTYANYSFGNGYATCATEEATTAKVATYSSYSKQHGGIVAVKFTYAVPANSTLNINSRGAHDIYYNGAKITAGIIGAGDTALFVYDSSTGYVLLSTQVVTKARLGAHKHTYTPAGTIGNATATGTVGNATAGGSVSSSFTGTAHNHGFTGTAHKHTFTGTAHNHTFTGTAATSGGPSGTTSVYSITGVGSLPSCTLPSTTVEYSNGELSITHTAGSFSKGSLPSRSEVTVASSNHTHSVTATGTIGNTTAGGSLDEVTATGTIGNTTAGGSVSSTFTGTAHSHGFTGTAHNHGFTGTAGTATTIS